MLAPILDRVCLSHKMLSQSLSKSAKLFGRVTGRRAFIPIRQIESIANDDDFRQTIDLVK